LLPTDQYISKLLRGLAEKLIALSIKNVVVQTPKKQTVDVESGYSSRRIKWNGEWHLCQLKGEVIYDARISVQIDREPTIVGAVEYD
jgi:hypothetical protein